MPFIHCCRQYGFKTKIMKEEQKIEQEFRKELQALLDKYDAEINLDQRGRAYMEYDVIQVTLNQQHDKETFEITRPMIDFDL